MTRGAVWWARRNRKKNLFKWGRRYQHESIDMGVENKRKMFENKNCLSISSKMFSRINIVVPRIMWTSYFSTNHLVLVHLSLVTMDDKWRKNGINDFAWLVLEFRPNGCSKQTGYCIHLSQIQKSIKAAEIRKPKDQTT